MGLPGHHTIGILYSKLGFANHHIGIWYGVVGYNMVVYGSTTNHLDWQAGVHLRLLHRGQGRAAQSEPGISFNE